MQKRYFIYCVLCLFHLVPSDVLAQSASFTSSVTSGCAPLAVSFTNTSTGATSYNWDFGNTATSAALNGSTSYSTPGTYTVTLTAINGAAQSTATTTIHVYGPPAVDFGGVPVSLCAGASVTFTDHSTLNSPGAATYGWNFGTGGTASGSPTSYIFLTAGTYNITLTVTNSAGCIASLTKPGYITVHARPVAGFFGNSPNLCSGLPVETFTNSTTGTPPFTSYWTFGDGGVSTQNNPAPHTYGGAGPYTVKLQVIDSNGCVDSITRLNYITVTTGTVPVFSLPPSACLKSLVFFSNTSSAFTGTAWDFGDGSGWTSGSPVGHAYVSGGTFTVTMANTFNGCTDTLRKVYTVYPPPPLNFTTNPTEPCPAPVSIHFTNPGGAVSYHWDFDDGGTSTAANPDHVYTQNDFFKLTSIGYRPFNIKYVAVTSHGCADSVTTPAVDILPFSAQIIASVKAGCIPFNDTFFVPPTLPVYPYPVISYNWHFGDGDSSNLPSPVHVFTKYGIDTVTAVVTASNGCSLTLSYVVRAGSLDTADFIATPTATCHGDTVKFTNLSHSATNYIWNFGDQTLDLDTNTIHFYSNPGVYTVMLTAINNGCPTTIVKKDYITVRFPKAQINFHYYCDGTNTIKLYNKSIGATSWVWDFGDGATDPVSDSPVHTYTSIGLYHVRLIVKNDTSGCHDDTVLQTVIISKPVASIHSRPAICLGDTINFVSSLSGLDTIPHDQLWLVDGHGFAIGPVPDSPNFVYRYSTEGHKPVAVIIQDFRNCFDTAYTNVTVDLPNVNFTASPLSICAGTSLTFTDQTTDSATGYTSRRWDFGDGTILNGNQTGPSHSYLNGGSYTVKLFVTDNVGCIDSAVKTSYVSVHKPTADFSDSIKFVCINTPLQFANRSAGSGLTYSWSFGDGGTSTLADPVHTYGHAAIYSVKLVVTDNLGCRDSITRVNYLTVVDNPVASFSLTDTQSVCGSLIDTFSNHSSSGAGITYNWSFGDGNTSTLFNTKNTYTRSGIFPVVLIVTNAYGCSDTASDTVKMLGFAGGGVFSYTPLSGCAPLSVNFTTNLTTGITSYVYDFNDGSTVATPATTVTHVYSKPGPHVPTLILIGTNGCRANSPGLDTIKIDGVYTGYTYVPNPACGNDTVHFTDTSHGAYSTSTRIWKFADGVTDTSVTTKHFFAPGTYSLSLYTVTSTGCTDTLNSHITVYNRPHISAGKDTILCVGDTALLSPSGGASYTWSPNYFITCTNCTNPSVSPRKDTGYIVTGTDSIGCKANDTVRITLKTTTTGSIDSSGSICQGGSFQLTAHAEFSNAQFAWTPLPGLSNPNISNPVATPDATTIYRVIIKEGRCIPDTLYATVTVYPLPVISLGPDQSIFAGGRVELKTTETGVSTYSWTPVDGLSCIDCPDPIASPANNITYVVTGYSDHGCKDTANIRITVVCDHSQVYLPNTFTPNGDGANDRFYPRGQGLKIIKSFRIYDRLGELVFSKQDINTNENNNGWDGSYKGQKLNSDIYVYVIDAICNTGESISWTGDIALLR